MPATKTKAPSAPAFKPLPGPAPDRRLVLVRYEEVDPGADTSAPQVGLFACEVAELVFAMNLGPVMLRQLRVGNTLYGSLRAAAAAAGAGEVRAEAPTFKVLGVQSAGSDSADPTPILPVETMHLAARWRVGYDVVALLREDADGQRWTAQAGVESSFRDGVVSGDGATRGPWALSRETYLYVCDKWGWDLVSDDLLSDPDDVGEADVEGDDGEEDPDDVMAPRSEVMAHVERCPTSFCVQFVSQQGGSLKEYALITRTRGASDFEESLSEPFQVVEGDGPDILLLDLSNGRHGEYGWRTVKDLCTFLGDVVWPDLTAFQLDRGWSIEDVMFATGIPGPWGAPTWDNLLDDADERRLEPWSGDPASTGAETAQVPV